MAEQNGHAAWTAQQAEALARALEAMVIAFSPLALAAKTANENGPAGLELDGWCADFILRHYEAMQERTGEAQAVALSATRAVEGGAA